MAMYPPNLQPQIKTGMVINNILGVIESPPRIAQMTMFGMMKQIPHIASIQLLSLLQQVYTIKKRVKVLANKAMIGM